MKRTEALGWYSRGRPEHAAIKRAQRRAERTATHQAVHKLFQNINSQPGVEGEEDFSEMTTELRLTPEAIIEAAAHVAFMPVRRYCGWDY